MQYKFFNNILLPGVVIVLNTNAGKNKNKAMNPIIALYRLLCPVSMGCY